MNRTTNSVLAGVAGLTMIVSASCKASYPIAPTDPSPVAFWVHYWTPVGLASVGGVYAFSAFILASDGAYEDVTARATWLESDSRVLRRAGSGLFPSAVAYSAVAPGDVEVAAQYEGLTSAISMSVIRPERQPFPNLTMTAVSAPRSRTERAISASLARECDHIGSRHRARLVGVFKYSCCHYRSRPHHRGRAWNSANHRVIQRTGGVVRSLCTAPVPVGRMRRAVFTIALGALVLSGVNSSASGQEVPGNGR